MLICFIFLQDSEKLLDKALSVGHVVSQLAFVLSEPVNDLTRQCTPKQTSQALINSFMGMCKRNSPSIWTIPFKENLSTEEDVQVNKVCASSVIYLFFLNFVLKYSLALSQIFETVGTQVQPEAFDG